MQFLLTSCFRAEVEKAQTENRQTRRTLRGCFLRGSNSTCRGHIAGHHFEEYERRCNAMILKVPLNFCCIPREVKKGREQGKAMEQAVLSF
jgi:hypothetical protein